MSSRGSTQGGKGGKKGGRGMQSGGGGEEGGRGSSPQEGQGGGQKTSKSLLLIDNYALTRTRLKRSK